MIAQPSTIPVTNHTYNNNADSSPKRHCGNGVLLIYGSIVNDGDTVLTIIHLVINIYKS